MTGLLFLILNLLAVPSVHAACAIKNSDGTTANFKPDLLYQTVSAAASCPTSVQELKQLLAARGKNPAAAMVANRGRNNPALGSFSFFESTPEGSLFFGHFTRANQGTLELEQTPAPGNLMIELIAWDPSKGYYNFYELIGNNGASVWFYRGDTKDILLDNEKLYLGSTPQFGNRLRCSACHASGGPIMKELELPHNDWWTATRPLPFGGNTPDAEVQQQVNSLMDASEFAALVKSGIKKLEQSSTYQALKQSNQVRLRPLFCVTEINLQSANEDSLVEVSSESIVSPLLGTADLSLTQASYQNLLNKFAMRFPETRNQDADHAWLVPVKGYSDHKAVESLVRLGIVDSEFVADVLAVDMENPLFSTARCELLKLVPQGSDWQQEFIKALGASSSPAAKELAANLTDPSRTATAHQLRAQALVAQKAQSLAIDGGESLFKDLLKARKSVAESEISKNKRGQILEPGFRVIFPQSAL